MLPVLKLVLKTKNAHGNEVVYIDVLKGRSVCPITLGVLFIYFLIEVQAEGVSVALHGELVWLYETMISYIQSEPLHFVYRRIYRLSLRIRQM